MFWNEKRLSFMIRQKLFPSFILFVWESKACFMYFLENNPKSK